MKNDKLRLWQERLKTNEAAFSGEIDKMDARELQYLGNRRIREIVCGDKTRKTEHIRNLSAEIIEAQIDSNIPQPKVTARRQGDEKKAKLIEDMLRNELDRLPFEMMNDMMERTVPIQGGGAFLVEWDSTDTSHTTLGELLVSSIHPKQIIPQDGVYSGIEDMDYIILKIPQTKEYIKSRYKVTVRSEAEEEPDVRTTGETSPAADMVTQYMAYYRNTKGGIGIYSWVEDTELEDIEDYQARRLRHCKVCGASEPTGESEVLPQLTPEGEKVSDTGERRKKNVCPYCGSTEWESRNEEYETLMGDIVTSEGTIIPAYTQDEFGVMTHTKIPYYKPDIFPIILQKNVSVFGRFLGDSDMDKIADQQNTVNRLESKIIDKLIKAGSYLTLPNDATVPVDTDELKIIRFRDPASYEQIKAVTVEANISQDIAYMQQVYEEARQTIGITDSFQGRKDATATSGKAKEFSAAQSAGRLESKRIMKNACYASLFEAMFKFKLAYADEPRPVVSDDFNGDKQYSEFNRYDFLQQDEAGEWFWNDDFLFSCDTSSPLASNREAMWQETRMNLQTGAYGNPQDLRTLILFWGKMDMLHYPGAADTKAYLMEELQRQQMMQMQEQQTIMDARAAAERDFANQRGITTINPTMRGGDMQ